MCVRMSVKLARTRREFEPPPCQRPLTNALLWSGHQCHACAITTRSTSPFFTPVLEKSSNPPSTTRTSFPCRASWGTLTSDFSHWPRIPADGSTPMSLPMFHLGYEADGGESIRRVKIPVPLPGSRIVSGPEEVREEWTVWIASAGYEGRARSYCERKRVNAKGAKVRRARAEESAIVPHRRAFSRSVLKESESRVVAPGRWCPRRNPRQRWGGSCSWQRKW